jgi:hypothetical protein
MNPYKSRLADSQIRNLKIRITDLIHRAFFKVFVSWIQFIELFSERFVSWIQFVRPKISKDSIRFDLEGFVFDSRILNFSDWISSKCEDSSSVRSLKFAKCTLVPG